LEEGATIASSLRPSLQTPLAPKRQARATWRRRRPGRGRRGGNDECGSLRSHLGRGVTHQTPVSAAQHRIGIRVSTDAQPNRCRRAQRESTEKEANVITPIAACERELRSSRNDSDEASEQPLEQGTRGTNQIAIAHASLELRYHKRGTAEREAPDHIRYPGAKTLCARWRRS
jgi:hypothetical protein